MLCTERSIRYRRKGNRWNKTARRVRFIRHRLALSYWQRYEVSQTHIFQNQDFHAWHSHAWWILKKAANSADRFQIQGTNQRENFWQQTPSMTCNATNMCCAVLWCVGILESYVSISYITPFSPVTCWVSHYSHSKDGWAWFRKLNSLQEHFPFTGKCFVVLLNIHHYTTWSNMA